MIGWLITVILYLPARWLFGAGTWTGIGPFDFQKSRVLLYFGYFVLGALMGNDKSGEGILPEGSRIVKRWLLWLVSALLIYILSVITGNAIIYAASCVASSIAFITFFRKWITTPRAWWNSLSANAYGIYLLHYIFVVWCQYGLLGCSMPAPVKFSITFLVALFASWLVSYAIRKNRIIGKYL